jgi:hypothetical protein
VNLYLHSIFGCCDIALGADLIRSARPIERIYLAKSAAAPLPLFCAHIPTVLLAAIGDEIYFDNNPHITRGLAVLSTEAWMMSLDGMPPIARLAHMVAALPSQLQVPTWKVIASQGRPPIQSKSIIINSDLSSD